MRLTGFGFSGVKDGPLDAGYTDLADVTVLIGPNDSGKSSTLALLAEALAPAPLEPLEELWVKRRPVPGTVVYARCSEGERDLLLTSIADPTHDPPADVATRSTPETEDDLVDAYFGGRAEPGGGVVQCWIDLEERLGPERAEIVLDALRSTRVFAFEARVLSSATSAPLATVGWAVHWCLPADHAIAGLARGHRLEEPQPPGMAPIALWTLGETTLQLLPAPVFVPRGLRTCLEGLEEEIGQLATHVRAQAGPDADPYEDAVWAGYDDYGSWVLGEDDGRAVRVDPLVIALVGAAQRIAQEHLPDFVRRTYDLTLQVRPILRWERDGRIAAELQRREDEAEPFPVDDAAAGLRTWVEIAVREAAAVVDAFVGVAQFVSVADHEWDLDAVPVPDIVKDFDAVMSADLLIDDHDILRRERVLPQRLADWLFGDLRRHPQDVARFLPRLLGRPLYLIDEPERHLQVGLQRSAARWIEDLFREVNGQAVVATHAPAFLSGGPDVQLVRINRNRPEDGLGPIDRAAMTATHDLSREMGFDTGELLAGLSAFLYVEGSVDRHVLEGLLGDELRAARIAVRAFGGTHNITEILADPLLIYTTARIAGLVDNVSDKELTKLRINTVYRDEQADEGRGEAGWLARLLKGAKARGRVIEPFGLPVLDIFFLLDDPALHRLSDRWPGHAEAWEQWRRQHATQGSRAQGWKGYFDNEFGVPVNNTTARRAAADMRERGAIPDKLREIVESVERLGLETR